MEVFNKTRFRQAYQMAMNEQAPKMYKELRAAKKLDAHIQEIADEAQLFYQQTLENLQENQGMGDEAKFIAAEMVFAEFIRFDEQSSLMKNFL